MPRGIPNKKPLETAKTSVEEVKPPAPSEVPAEEKATASKKSSSDLMSRIQELERRDEENQKRLKMLYEVADKARVFNYESKQAQSGSIRVKLSKYNNNIVVGWRTLKDEIIHDPRTGAVVGENQQYELLLLTPTGETLKDTVQGYVNFSNLRYEDRIDCAVTGKTTTFDGRITYSIALPDGREINLDEKFIN